jgi:hypothetical protein
LPVKRRDELNAWLADESRAKAHADPERPEQTIWELFEAIRSAPVTRVAGSDVSRSSYCSAPVRIIAGQFSSDANSPDEFFFIHGEPAGAISESILSDFNGLRRHSRVGVL